MRLQLHSVVPAAAALLGSSALGAAAATDIDPSYAVRGSLGGSLEDLMLGTGNGALVFFVNAGCLLLLGALAIIAQRKRKHGAERPASRTYTDYAR